MLQPIATAADLRHATALLQEGFPERAPTFWVHTVARLQAQAGQALDQQPWGQFLLHQGQPVGILLTLGSWRHPAAQPAYRVVNLSSWYVQMPHRWQAARMLGRLLADPDTTYTDLTPSPSVQRMLPHVGMVPVNSGVLLHLLPQHLLRCPGRPDASLRPLPAGHCSSAHGLPPQLLQAHLALGCLALLLQDDEGTQLLVLRPIRLRGLPAALVVFAESQRRWRAQLGLLARHLLRRGLLCLVSDQRPGDCTRGAVVRPRSVWFAKGRCFADRTDLLGSELCLLPH